MPWIVAVQLCLEKFPTCQHLLVAVICLWLPLGLYIKNVPASVDVVPFSFPAGSFPAGDGILTVGLLIRNLLTNAEAILYECLCDRF